MKKIVLLSLVTTILLSGCSGTSAMETMHCDYKNMSGSLETKISYDIDHEDEKIKKVRITYNYDNTSPNSQIDGVGTGTDGTTNDNGIDNDGIIDGIIGETIDDIIGGMTDIILDISGIKDRHVAVQNAYGSINGFSVGSTTDTNNNYKVTYVIDYDAITEEDLSRFNLSRDLNTLRDNYINQGFTCK